MRETLVQGLAEGYCPADACICQARQEEGDIRAHSLSLRVISGQLLCSNGVNYLISRGASFSCRRVINSSICYNSREE